ncbi:hypothetical protein MRB53_039050 [Persea americana]|nr:hypothetical protein MRB53_039050 [Persea americana]
MGCATSLFPILGHVANLVRRVCRTKYDGRNITLLTNAVNLQQELESWQCPPHIQPPSDPSTTLAHYAHTAEAYRLATLLCLHQAVPDMDSRTSADLSSSALQHLSKVPMTSTAILVQIYPLLAAGCEATSAEDRLWVKQRWANMVARMNLSGLERCWEVTLEVWKRRDQRALAIASSTPASRSPATSPPSRKTFTDLASAVPADFLDMRRASFADCPVPQTSTVG